jgi:hypothetical protein
VSSSTGKLTAGLVGIVFVGVAAVALLVLRGGGEPAAAPGAGAETSAPAAAEALLFGPAAEVDEAALLELEKDPAVAKVHRYLSGELPDGTPVVGLEPLDAPLRGPEGEPLSARFLVGRGLQQAETGPAGVAGVTWAEQNKSIYGYQVAGMIDSHPARSSWASWS